MRDLLNVCKYLKGGCQEDRMRPLLAVLSNRIRGNGHKLKQEILHKCDEKLLYCESDWTLVQVTPRSCGISLSGDIKKKKQTLPQTSVAILCNILHVILLEQGVGPDGLQRSLPTSAILWFCVLTDQKQKSGWALEWKCLLSNFHNDKNFSKWTQNVIKRQSYWVKSTVVKWLYIIMPWSLLNSASLWHDPNSSLVWLHLYVSC